MSSEKKLACQKKLFPEKKLLSVMISLAAEITQVIDSIPWVRCASGNVSSVKWPVGNWCPINDPSPYHTMFLPYGPLKQATYTKFANQRCGIYSGVGLEPVGKWFPITAAEAHNGLWGPFLLMKRALCVFVFFVNDNSRKLDF